MSLLMAELASCQLLEPRWMPDLLYYQDVLADIEIHRESADPALTFELVPSASYDFMGVEEWGDDPRTVTTNSLGFRDVERAIDKPDGVFRIIALGGSNTYGAAVTQGRTWPAFLEEELTSRYGQPVEVWNMGVDGYVPTQKAVLARRALREYSPDLIIWQHSNLGPRHLLPGPWSGLKRQLRANPELRWEYLKRTPGSEATALWRLATRSALYRTLAIVSERRERSAMTREAALPDDAFPGFLWGPLDQGGADDFSRLVQEADPVPLVLFRPPVDRLEGDPFADLPGRTIDLLALFDGVMERPAGIPALDDIHPGVDGYRYYGRILADLLVAGGCVDRERTCSVP